MKKILFIIPFFLWTCGGGGGSTGPEEDTTPPSITIQNPLSGSTVNEIITVQINAQDNIGVSKIEMLVNDQLIHTVNAAIMNYEFNTSSLSDGNHTLSAKAYDTSDNQTLAQPVLFTVDNSQSQPTKIWLNVYQENPLGSEHQSRIWIHNENQNPSNVIRIDWRKSPDSDFKSYHLYKSMYPDMFNKELVYSSENKDNSNYDFPYNGYEIFYFQLEVEDQIGLKTLSNITRASTYKTYYYNEYVEETGGQGDDVAAYFAYEIEDGKYFGIGDNYFVEKSLNGQNRGVGLYQNSAQQPCYSNNSRSDNVVRNWERSGYEYPRKIEVAEDGFLMVVGLDGNNSIDKEVIKIDFNGNEIWRVDVSEDGDSGTQIEPTNDGGAIISNRTSNNVGELIRVDSSGNELWKKEYDNNYITSIIKSNNSDEFILGNDNSYYDESTNTHTHINTITKIDSNGNLLSSWSTNSIGGSDNSSEYINHLISLSDGNFLAIINNTLYVFNYSLFNVQTSRYQEYKAINSTKDGVVLVELNENTVNYDLIVLDNQLNEINRFNSILGCQAFVGSWGYHERIDYVFQTDDNGFIVSGQMAMVRGRLVMKLDPQGEYHSKAISPSDYGL